MQPATQAPALQTSFVGQAVSDTQAPVALHVWGVFAEQTLVPGMQATQAPPTQKGKLPEQGKPTSCQVPDAVHSWG